MKQEDTNNEGKSKKDSKDHSIILNVIVSGTPTNVVSKSNEKLRKVAEDALEQTGNTGRPLDEWTLKTREGAELSFDQKVEDAGLADGLQLVLSLNAGVGG